MYSYEKSEAHKKMRSLIVQEHPCYGSGAHFKFGRVHLPVVSTCNIGCNYCVRKYDCANENRPGVTSKVIMAEEALQRVRFAVQKDPRLRVVGIAGPGDPLSNDVTFDTLRLVQKEFPHLTRCISTNGLLLPEKLAELKEVGVSALTITINAVDPAVGEQIYSFVRYQNKLYRGRKAFEVLSKNQLDGLRAAAEAGIVVKVNSVFIPGVNSEHLVDVARTVRDLGAYIMNIMPLIPQAKFAHFPAPSLQEIQRIRHLCEGMLFQFHNCVQCRADAIGVPSEESCGAHFTGFGQSSDPEVK
jgi:nitrogen fixation protein NifB